MNTHDHASKKQANTDSNHTSQEEPISDNLSGLGSFHALQRAIKNPGKETLTPRTVLQLQRTIGNQSTLRLLNSSREGSQTLQREQGDDTHNTQQQNERTRNTRYRITLACVVDNALDVIGHSYIIVETRNREGNWGDKRTWGFYPVISEGLVNRSSDTSSGTVSSVPGQVVIPDPHHNDSPDIEYSRVINQTQLNNAIAYMEAHRNLEYSLFGYNCAAFANGMFEAATGIHPNTRFLMQTPANTASGIINHRIADHLVNHLRHLGIL